MDNSHQIRKMGFVKQIVHSTEADEKLPEVTKPPLGSGCLMNISPSCLVSSQLYKRGVPQMRAEFTQGV